MSTNQVKPPRTNDRKEIDLYRQKVAELLNKKKAAAQSDSTATTVADLKSDFNSLLAKLRAADLMDS